MRNSNDKDKRALPSRREHETRLVSALVISATVLISILNVFVSYKSDGTTQGKLELF